MNNLEKTQYFHKLYDIYGILLTEKQRDYFELYYFEDLSLSEIAEELNISRNAIHKNVQQTLKLLENYESKLHFFEKTNLIIDKLSKSDISEKLIQEIEDIL